MSVTPGSDCDVWLRACQRAGTKIGTLLKDTVGVEQRVREVGTRGCGGDLTLVLDAKAEEAVFGELAALHEQGLNFQALSEERGEVSFGAVTPLVVVDPIDGSLNAKRGAPHHALSIGVADGPRMDDVRFGYVYDFGTHEEWWAASGSGAFLNGSPIDPTVPARCSRDGRLELLAIESGDPHWLRVAGEELERAAHRLRALGSISVALCEVASARVDGMATLRPARAVDAAAAQLIVREAGGMVAFPELDPPLSAPLDLDTRTPLTAARGAEPLKLLEGICRHL